MTQSTRKLIGTVLIILVLLAYAWLAVAVYLQFFTAVPTVAQLLYFAVAGLGWAVPASFVIRWMVRPDERP